MANGTLGEKGEHDWLAVTLATGQAYEFTITGLTDLASIQVGTAAALDKGIVADQVVNVFPGSATPQTQAVWFTPDSGGTYYIDISDPATIGGYSVTAVTVPNEFPDDTSTTGVVTVDGSATSGTLGEKGERDWLAVTLAAGQAYEFTITGLSNLASTQVGTAAALDKGVVADQVVSVPGGTATPQTQHVWFTPDSSGTYYVDISDPATIGGYSVSAVAVSNDYPDNTSTTGVVSIGGSTTSGTLGQPGEHDWLAVTLAAGQAYEFTITGLSDLAFPIVGTAAALDEGIVSDQVTDVFPGTATPENRNVWFTPDTTGTYYVDISDPATIGGYSVSAVAVPNDFPDNTSTAGVVTVGGSATSGTLGEKGEHDWLAVTLSQGQAYEFTVTGFSNYGFVMVGTAAALDEGVVAVATGNIPPATVTPQTQQVWFTPDTTGTYYVDVSDAATIGGYSVSAIAVPNDFPNNTSTTGVVTPGGTVASGTLGEPGEHDWFAVTLAGGQAYEFTVTGLSNLAQTRVGAAAALDEGVVADEVFEVPAGIATPQTQNIWFTPDTSGTYYVDISDPATIGAYGVSVVPVSNDFPDNTSTTGVVNVVCFTQGTRIATPDGEVPVEDLSVGDLVLAQFAGLTQIKWIGHRTIDCRRHPRPREVWPVRVRAQAFSPSQPHRDLLLSPDHAVFVDGMLIPVRQLINHTTIAQEPATLVTYYHVELARHDVLNAEGLPAESYLDTGNRAFFGKSDEPLVLHPDLTDEADYPAREAGSCAPFVRDEANVRPVWQRVSERAAAIGRPELPRATTTDADLRLLADRCPVNPVFSDSDRVIFVLPRSAKEVRLLSRAQSPTEARPWLDDRRKLGVRVKRIVLRGADELREIPVDHPDLTWGWWAVERDGQIMSRWTDGEAVLPLPTMSGHVMLELHLAGSMIYVEEAAPARGTELVAAA